MNLSRWAAAALVSLTASVEARLVPDVTRLDTLPLHVVPAAAADKAVAAAANVKGQGPSLFAATVALPVTLDGGRWDEPAAGVARWRTRVFSADAKALALEFDAFSMPAGGQMWIYDADGRWLQGPYTSANHNPEGLLWTALVSGETAVIEARIPASARDAFKLHLARVGHAFRDPFKVAKALGDSGGCNFDVVCPTGNDWQRESRSTVRLQIPAGAFLGFCSGSLVNNVAQDNRNYILTADHCEIGQAGSPASGVVVYWRFENTVCRGADNANDSINQSGTVLRADDVETDFTLLELSTAIPGGANPYYAGWDSSGAGASCGVGIHHPAGDAKKIAEFRTPLTEALFQFSATDPQIPTWKVARWDVGTTEQGSSGSGLWNQHHRIVGTLSGGQAACNGSADDNNLPDFYARTARQWTRGLSAFLDPGGTGIRCMTGKEPDAAGTSCTPGTGNGLVMACSAPAPTAPQNNGGGGGGGSPAPLALGTLLGAALLRRRRH